MTARGAPVPSATVVVRLGVLPALPKLKVPPLAIVNDTGAEIAVEAGLLTIVQLAVDDVESTLDDDPPKRLVRMPVPPRVVVTCAAVALVRPPPTIKMPEPASRVA